MENSHFKVLNLIVNQPLLQKDIRILLDLSPDKFNKVLSDLVGLNYVTNDAIKISITELGKLYLLRMN